MSCKPFYGPAALFFMNMGQSGGYMILQFK